MKVFISWSGSRSRAVAELLNDWVKCVLQATRPWLSTRDIDRGALWFSEIHDQLKDTSVGVVCLTQANRNRPWILFESGALAKGLSSNRVCTFLIDLKPADLEDPLAQFNHTMPEKGSIWELVRTLNNCLDSNALDERILEQVFDTYWPQFESQFAKILKKHPETEKSEPRPKEDILAEILGHTRSMQSRLRRLENLSDRDGSRDERSRMESESSMFNRAQTIYHHVGDQSMEEIMEAMHMNEIPSEVAMHVIELNHRDRKRKTSKHKSITKP